MNILYLKYAHEVARSGSISKAAKQLFVAQPNISRAIKELETSLGITIFERTTKGMILTPDGERLMQYANNILNQIQEVEEIFLKGEGQKQKFSISVPRVSYISYAFSRFSLRLPEDTPVEIFYKETNALRAINNILRSDYKLGIIRYAARHERYFRDLLEEKELVGELVTEFHYVLIMNARHPLAKKEEIGYEDLKPYLEIAHADPYVPFLSLSEVRREELPEDTNRRIFVFERASQFEVLAVNPEAFMWVSSVPDELLDRYGLVERKCRDNEKIYRDVLIHRKDYRLTELDKMFVEELGEAKLRFL